MNLITLPKSVIPSLDFTSLDKLREVVSQTADVTGIGGYKIGFELALTHGIAKTVQEIRKISSLPIIYDHQKAATDIPDTGVKFVEACKDVDGIILFPQAGPVTLKAWVQAVKDAKKTCIVGGEMTHEGYLDQTGGFIKNTAPDEIYQLAAEQGVTDFVVPGNKPEKIKHYKSLIEQKNIVPVLYSPGLVTQGGNIAVSSEAAGEHWHAIVGRALYDASDVTKVAQSLIEQL